MFPSLYHSYHTKKVIMLPFLSYKKKSQYFWWSNSIHVTWERSKNSIKAKCSVKQWHLPAWVCLITTYYCQFMQSQCKETGSGQNNCCLCCRTLAHQLYSHDSLRMILNRSEVMDCLTDETILQCTWKIKFQCCQNCFKTRVQIHATRTVYLYHFLFEDGRFNSLICAYLCTNKHISLLCA